MPTAEKFQPFHISMLTSEDLQCSWFQPNHPASSGSSVPPDTHCMLAGFALSVTGEVVVLISCLRIVERILIDCLNAIALQAVAFYEYQDVPGSDEEMPDCGAMSDGSQGGSQNGAASPPASNSSKRRRCTSSAASDASTGPASMADDAASRPQPDSDHAAHADDALHGAQAGKSPPDAAGESVHVNAPNPLSGQTDAMESAPSTGGLQRTSSPPAQAADAGTSSSSAMDTAARVPQPAHAQHDADHLETHGSLQAFRSNVPGIAEAAAPIHSQADSVQNTAGQGMQSGAAPSGELPQNGARTVQPPCSGSNIPAASMSASPPIAANGRQSGSQGPSTLQSFSDEPFQAPPEAGPASAATLLDLEAAVQNASRAEDIPAGGQIDALGKDASASECNDAGMRHLRLQQWPPENPMGTFPAVSHADPPAIPVHCGNGVMHGGSEGAAHANGGSAHGDSQSQPTYDRLMAADAAPSQEAAGLCEACSNQRNDIGSVSPPEELEAKQAVSTSTEASVSTSPAQPGFVVAQKQHPGPERKGQGPKSSTMNGRAKAKS